MWPWSYLCSLQEIIILCRAWHIQWHILLEIQLCTIVIRSWDWDYTIKGDSPIKIWMQKNECKLFSNATRYRIFQNVSAKPKQSPFFLWQMSKMICCWPQDRFHLSWPAQTNSKKILVTRMTAAGEWKNQMSPIFNKGVLPPIKNPVLLWEEIKALLVDGNVILRKYSSLIIMLSSRHPLRNTYL